MGRAPCCEKVGLKKGKWSKEEDALLSDYIAVHGPHSWRALPKRAGLLRCGKSCRLRWVNYLRPHLKRGHFSPREDQIILDLHSSLGNRWSMIAAHLPGRTDNEIKNYWNSHLSRKIQSLAKMVVDETSYGGVSKKDDGDDSNKSTNSTACQVIAAREDEIGSKQLMESEEEEEEQEGVAQKTSTSTSEVLDETESLLMLSPPFFVIDDDQSVSMPAMDALLLDEHGHGHDHGMKMQNANANAISNGGVAGLDFAETEACLWDEPGYRLWDWDWDMDHMTNADADADANADADADANANAHAHANPDTLGELGALHWETIANWLLSDN